MSLSKTLLAAPFLCLVVTASGQTLDQLQQFQQLKPEQREAVMKALKGGDKYQNAEAVTLSQPELVAPAPAPAANTTHSTIEQRYAGRTGAFDLRATQSARAVSQQLKQFGYDLFSGSPTTFAPATDIPVPADYVIGPGDVIEVQLFGKENENYKLAVSRDGRINFPQIGAINVAGLRFTDLRTDIEKRISEQMIGVKANVTMGALRSIRIFVLGDVTRPGSYTVSALTTMTNALFVSGGVRPIGSLRNVQLKRNGRVVTRLDLYDLLLRGDTSDDARLQPGDVIFVPPIGATAGVAGEVHRPAIYELRGEKTVKQIVEMAGGLLATAVPALSQLERLDAKGNRTLVELNLDKEDAARAALADGDVLRVYPSLDRMEGIVLLAGHVKRPGGVAWHDHMRLSDLLPSADTLLPQPDLEYVVVRREERPLAKVSVFSTRLSAAWANPESDANTLLEPRDQVFVFPAVVTASTTAAPASMSVATGPAIGAPASAALVPGSTSTAPGPATVAGSAPAASALAPVAPESKAVAPSSTTGSTVVPESSVTHGQAGVQPASDASASETKALPSPRQVALKPLLDELAAQAASGQPTRIVSVNGLVRDEGNYPLESSMRVSDLLRAGGGLDEAAYTLGAEITRYTVVGNQKREVSHIPVDLALLLKGDASANLALEPFDKLTIKRLPEWSEQLTAEVRGEVRFPGVYPIKRGEKLSDLLARAGGLTEQAFPEGSVFMREELRLKEQERLDTLARQLESDIASLSLENAQEGKGDKSAEALTTARSLLPQLRSAKATGRLVIDLPRLLDRGKNSDYDVALKGGDTLVIPQKTQEVTVIGEVQYPTSHLIENGLNASDYMDRSGGLTYRADSGRAYVVRANGLVEPTHRGWWLFRNSAEVKAGDTIVVPMDVDRMRPLTFWTSISQIVYQLAVTIAVLNNIGAL